jgi:hypothetical protein
MKANCSAYEQLAFLSIRIQKNTLHLRKNAASTSQIKFYYVDEAGDPNLFDRKGKVIIGTEGVSSYFMLGCLEVADTDKLSAALTNLRLELLSDPYFKDIPSFDPSQRKTAVLFHAKDDVPEVRRAVFSLLRDFEGLRFYASVVGKRGFAQHVLDLNARNKSYRYRPNELYDQLAKRLFKDKIHQSDEYRICFARRGSSDRTAALKQALVDARNAYAVNHKIQLNSELVVTASDPTQAICLQACDYFLWALQRLYERKEDRYFNYLSHRFSQIIDINDLRMRKTGAYYSRKKPLTLAALEGRD